MINEEIVCLGGIGEKTSNGGRQYFQQDRVYSSEGVACALPAILPGGSYLYLIDTECGYRLTDIPFVNRHYRNFIEKNHYIPKLFSPFNEIDVGDISPSITTWCGGATKIDNVLVLVNESSNFNKDTE